MCIAHFDNGYKFVTKSLISGFRRDVSEQRIGPVRMGPIRCSETSVNNYHTTSRNTLEDSRFVTKCTLRLLGKTEFFCKQEFAHRLRWNTFKPFLHLQAITNSFNIAKVNMEPSSTVQLNCAVYNRHTVLTRFVGEWNFHIGLTK
jgi:hypothetical protein